MIASLRWPIPEQAAALALLVAVVALPNGNRPVHVARSFYGTHKVVERPGSPFRILMHGVTLHGAQRIAPEGSTARPLPLTYYHPSGPLAHGLLLARAAAGGTAHPLRVGIIGLGAGAMACHAIDGDRWSSSSSTRRSSASPATPPTSPISASASRTRASLPATRG